MENEMNLSDREKEAFHKLNRTLIPNANLEEEIINKLKSQNLITKKMDRKPYYIGIAASVVLFIIGYFIGGTTKSVTLADLPSEYILLLSEDENFQPNKDNEALVTEYENWLITQSNSGVAITGAELGHQEDKTDYPMISGFFMLNASSQEEAKAIAATCPHIKYGGKVEVRKVVKH